MDSAKNTSQAQVKPLKSISVIWLVPIIALLIGAWMIYAHVSSLGPLVTINFETGEGIEAGKTKIKIKNVEVGLVTQVELSDDQETIEVIARIQRDDRDLLKADTQFWVVRPRIGKGGISGLGTLLSGAYIELAPGSSNEKKYQFTGLENEPVTPAGTPGIHVTLEGGSHRAMKVGDPILFHGVDVGRIEYVFFNTSERSVYYNAFIESPYDKLVTTNTKFWEVNGFELELSADGIHFQSGTLETMIAGGVAFDVPHDMPRGELVTEREYFTIFPNRNAILESRYKNSLHYILLFKDSIRGLKPGAPVEYRGVKVGTVTRTDVKYPEITNVLDQDTLIPVMISIEPARMGFEDEESALSQVEESITALLLKGLRGALTTGNLLTGGKYIELEYDDEAIPTDLEKFSGYPIIPTLESQLGQIFSKANKIMDKLYNLPLETVLNSADKTLLQATASLQELQSLAGQLEILLKQASDENLIGSVQSTLTNLDKFLSDFSEGSLTHEELQSTLWQLKNMIAEMRALFSQLNQKPNSLIFSNPKNKDIEPKGVQ